MDDPADLSGSLVNRASGVDHVEEMGRGAPPLGTTRRPHSVTLVGVVFLLFGVMALPLSLFRLIQESGWDSVADRFVGEPFALGLPAMARVAALVGGWYVLQGAAWARNLLLGWVFYYMAIAAFHGVEAILIHSALAMVVAYALCRTGAKAFFRSSP